MKLPLKVWQIGSAVAIIIFSAWIPVNAEEVSIPAEDQGESWNGDKPTRGLSKTQVQEQFGEPQSTAGPRGEPPIYFWEYPDFTVYFEDDRVIHAVIKTRQ